MAKVIIVCHVLTDYHGGSVESFVCTESPSIPSSALTVRLLEDLASVVAACFTPERSKTALEEASGEGLVEFWERVEGYAGVGWGCRE
jgi:hypothetical protein